MCYATEQKYPPPPPHPLIDLPRNSQTINLIPIGACNKLFSRFFYITFKRMGIITINFQTFCKTEKIFVLKKIMISMERVGF